MPKFMKAIPAGTCYRIVKGFIKSRGMGPEEFRIGNDAMIELSNILMARAEEIVVQALKLAKHAGRKTLKRSDIELASR